MFDTIYKVSDISFKAGYMNMFLIGVLVGAGAFALLYIVMIISKIHMGMLYLHQSMDGLTKAVTVALTKLAKIERVTDNTMIAAENFVDAMRESAEQMMVRPPNKKFDDSQQFDDLRQAFDDGIRQMEEDDEDEEGEEPKNKWKP
jgi:hypothetical protein